MTHEEEYKGHKIIVLEDDPNIKKPFKFGIRKAKLIVDNIKDIKAFVEKNTY